MSKLLEAVTPFLFKGDGSAAYAILDGASIPDLLDKLYAEQRPKFECLYTGDLKPDMAEAAPYMVRLDPNEEFTRWLFEECWGKHWGIFAVTTADFIAFRKHLRRFLLVHDTNGKGMYFRYYDPRVLRDYLPTCLPGEVDDFFGPVSTWLMELEDAGKMLRFLNDGGKLTRYEDALEPA